MRQVKKQTQLINFNFILFRVVLFDCVLHSFFTLLLVCDLLDLSPCIFVLFLSTSSESALSPFSFSSLPAPRRRGPHNILLRGER